MTTITTKKAFAEVVKHHERIKNDEPQTIGDWNTAGNKADCWPQGDLLLVCLDRVPDGVVPIKAETQLAPGTSQGSRHCLASLVGVEMFRLPNATPLDGPIIRCREPVTVTHPEHGNVTLPAGVFGVVYQRALADELRRVRD